MSIVGFETAGVVDAPSPSVWSDCPKSKLIDEGLGYYVPVPFAGNTATLPGLPADSDSGSTFTYNDGTQSNRALNLAVTDTDNNAAAIFTRPVGRIVRGSGNKIWFEASLAPAALGDTAFFVGLGELAALVRDAVADNPSNSAAAAPITESVVGFVSVQSSSAIATVNAVVRKDNGTVRVVATNVTNSSRLTTGANLVANAFRKYAVKFDGTSKIEFFVDGIKVADTEVDGGVDQSKDYGGLVCIKTGSAAAATYRSEFFHAAAQVR